jgi:hypothetical protein
MIDRAKSNPNGTDTVRDLIGALTRFHSYIRKLDWAACIIDIALLRRPALSHNSLPKSTMGDVNLLV